MSYRAAHKRVAALWGRAAEHDCVACGGPAAEWAYDGTDPNELTHMYRGRFPMKYSTDPAFYMPMCRSCHRIRDAKDVCAKGHEMTEDNIYRVPTRPNNRRCRKCIKEGQRQAYLNRKARAGL